MRCYTLLLGLTLIACGSPKKQEMAEGSQSLPKDAPAQESTQEREEMPSPLTLKQFHIVLGGFSSCPDDPEAQQKTDLAGDAWLDILNSQIAAEGWILSCYGIDHSEILWLSSDKPDHLTRGSRAEFFELIDEKIESLNVALNMVGHSYGAWTALQYASSMQKRGDAYRLSNLVTLDPINFEICSIAAGIADPLSLPDNCRGAPTGVSLDTLPEPSVWLNYYQQDEVLIHSGEIGAAHENKKVPYEKGGLLEFAAHSRFTGDAKLAAEAIAKLAR